MTNYHRGSVDNTELEITLLLEAIYLQYGYDFRHYSRASIKRRIQRRLKLEGLQTIAEMQHRVIHEPAFCELILNDLSIHVTEMFRDPRFFLALRHKVLPQLASCEFLRIWHAGCASGEEVYSIAILLMEEGLYDRSLIYATDFNDRVLNQAREGIYAVKTIQQGIVNYRQAGGKASFADYYSAAYDHGILRQDLKRNIVFSNHNLTTDRSFGEMDLIVCRNVLIYFDTTLQRQVLQLFHESLREGGFLGLGSKETVRFAANPNWFAKFIPEEAIYKKDDRLKTET